MKLVNARLGLELDFIENKVINITIEKQEQFSRAVYSICSQIDGGEGDFILSEVEKELLLEKKAYFVSNPLMVTCNEKKIVSQIYKIISESINKEFFLEFASVNQEICKFMELLINSSEYNLTLDFDFQSLALVKYCNVHVDSVNDNYTEKFIDYLHALKEICNIEVVFVLNLKQYFGITELEEIYKQCFYMKLFLVNIEGKKSDSIKDDKYIIIDEDFCILEFSH